MYTKHDLWDSRARASLILLFDHGLVVNLTGVPQCL